MNTMRQEGFYDVIVKEYGPPFRTIGLWTKESDTSGYWRFAEGDGDEQSVNFTIISIDEEMIQRDRIYKEDDLIEK